MKSTPFVSGLVEPVAVQDDFVQGIGKIELIGPCARFILFAEQSIPEHRGQTIRVVVRKIVIPMENLPAAIQQTLGFAASHATRRVAEIVRG